MKNSYFIYVIIGMALLTLLGCSQRGMGLIQSKYTSPARHKATMKPYQVKGKRYYPGNISVGHVEYGISSWYGPDFHGKYTSNGEVYNMHARTAAHKTWPMDTIARVTNIENGKSTVVRINDRGPFVSGRIIDCSYAAGKALGLDKMGIAKVKVKVLGFAGKKHPAKKRSKVKKVERKSVVKLSNVAVQVGAFSHYQRANKYQDIYAKKYPRYRSVIQRLNQRGIILYRVLLVGFVSKSEAQAFKERNDLYGAAIVTHTSMQG